MSEAAIINGSQNSRGSPATSRDFEPGLVSVCMPCHNAERHLQDSLESLLTQDYRHIEIIAVNDSSNDRTAELLSEVQSRRRVKAFDVTFRNAARTRNFAFQQSRGEFIKYMDADDVISTDLIGKQVARLRQSPQAIATARWTRFFERRGDRPFEPDGTWQDRESLDWLLESIRDGGHHSMLQSAIFLIPRSVHEKAGGWDERLTLIDDTEFFGRQILASNAMLFTDGALYYRSGMTGSLSARKSRAAYESASLSLTLFVQRILERDDSDHTRKVCADFCRMAYFDLYPHHPDLAAPFNRRCAELGGSSLTPAGGPVFRGLSKVVGWSAATRLRQIVQRCGYERLRSFMGRRSMVST